MAAKRAALVDPRQQTFEFGLHLASRSSPLLSGSSGTPGSMPSVERNHDSHGSFGRISPPTAEEQPVGDMPVWLGNDGPWTSPSVDLMLKLEKAERRLDEIVAAEVAVILEELVDEVARSATLGGLQHRRNSFTSKQKAAFVSAVDKLKNEYP